MARELEEVEAFESVVNSVQLHHASRGRNLSRDAAIFIVLERKLAEIKAQALINAASPREIHHQHHHRHPAAPENP